jgi:AbiV family abortive infection protein
MMLYLGWYYRTNAMEIPGRHQFERLVQTRREMGISQADLAARMGTTQPALARLEGSPGDPRLSTLERYAKALNDELTTKGLAGTDAFTIDQIEEMIAASFSNSSRLASDARLLLDGGRFPTAYAIAELACEEAGKILMLAKAGIEAAIGQRVDWKGLRGRLTDHGAKIRTLWLFAWAIEEQEASWRSGDLEALLADSQGRRKAASEAIESLLLRERALYVEIGPLGLSTPDASVRAEDAGMMVKLIEDLLGRMRAEAVPRRGALKVLARDPASRKKAIGLRRMLNRLPAVIPFEQPSTERARDDRRRKGAG